MDRLNTTMEGGVLHVVEHCAGGVETYVRRTMRRQQATGRWGAIRLAADPDFVDPAFACLADKIAPYRSSRQPHLALNAARRVERIVRDLKPGLVHLHSSYPGLYGRLLAKRGPNAPAIVYCPHGWSFDMDTCGVKRNLFRKVERRLAKATDVVVAISEHEYQGAESVCAPSDGLVLIPHGVRPPNPGPRPAAMDPANLNLLFVGRFGRQKGLDLLLAAFRRVRRQDVRLHVLGRPDPGPNAQLDDVDPRVLIHGWVDNADIDPWYAAADALVVPSRWEGFGLVVAEAMRNQTAVIASIRGALPEILDHGGVGRLFDPEDSGDLARLIDRLDRQDLTAMGAAGHARYSALYTEDRAATALDDAYALALERRRRRR